MDRSIGYRYEWKIEEAQKNLLRTHTTAVSARMLYKLMQQVIIFRELSSVSKVFEQNRIFSKICKCVTG